MTRPRRRHTVVPALIVPLALLLILLAPRNVLGCSCMSSGSACASMGLNDAIFVGTAGAIEPQGGPGAMGRVRVPFQIEQRIKGIDAETVTIETNGDTAACGYPFRAGGKYLVYASKGASSFSVSLCSRTGPLESRRDDLELLRETASGVPVRPRLFGTVYRLQLELDGAFMHHTEVGGVPDVPIRVRDGAAVRDVRTDAQGHFSIVGLTPGRYVVEATLPPRLARYFPEELAATVDECFGQLSVPVTTVPLRGTARPADGTAGGRQMMLRLAQVGPAGGVTIERSTLAFTEPDGTWAAPGLPPGRYLLSVGALDPPTTHTPYPATWYPTAARPENATVLEVSDDRSLSVDFRLPPRLPERTVTGVTVDTGGTPVPHVDIALHDTGAGASFARVASATSDDRGRFSITGLRGRHYRIQGQVIQAGGMQSDLVDLPDDADRGVTVTLKPRR